MKIKPAQNYFHNAVYKWLLPLIVCVFGYFATSIQHENARLYFFSTAAQVLVALLAFLGIFIIFRIETIRSLERELFEKIVQEAVERHFEFGLDSISKKEAIKRVYALVKDKSDAASQQIKRFITNYQLFVTLREMLINRSERPAKEVLVVLGYCFIGIALAKQNPSLQRLIFPIGLFAVTHVCSRLCLLGVAVLKLDEEKFRISEQDTDNIQIFDE